MTDFAVTGKKRSGKGLFCVGLIRDALRDGKRVATNMDIYLDKLLPAHHKAMITRLPDFPTREDFEAIGKGNDIVDDDRNGLLILDETSAFFNARAWGDKNRQPALDWLIHSGKLGWDIYYQMQGLEQVDKQLRNTQVEFHVPVKKTDRWRIPFVTTICSLVGLDVRVPRMHLGIYKQGVERDSMITDRKFYRAKDLYNAYDTRQVFLDRDHPDAVGIHTVLSPWYIKGRYLPDPPSKLAQFFYGVIGKDWTVESSKTQPRLKPKLPLVEALTRLPPDDAIFEWRRLEAAGAI